MESPGNNLLRFLVERDPASPEFRSGVREALRSPELSAELPGGNKNEFDLWRDVFVQQKLPWGRFLQSALLHATAVALIYAISLSWIQQQKILASATFDRSSLVTYSPEEYLPSLDTGTSEPPKSANGRSRLREAADPFRSAGSGQSVPNYRCAARSQARSRRRLAQHCRHGSHRSGGSAGCDTSYPDPYRCARDANCGTRARRGVCARPCGPSGDEIRCDCAASGIDAIVISNYEGTRRAH